MGLHLFQLFISLFFFLNSQSLFVRLGFEQPTLSSSCVCGLLSKAFEKPVIEN
jgi:hypothetical protein